MPIFRYQGYKQDGSYIAGTIEADGHKDAVLKVRTNGVFPKEVSETVPFKKKIFQWQNPAARLPDLTRHLATMLCSGVPLIDAVSSSAAEQKGIWKGILIDMKDRLSSGSTFARAAQAYPDIFPEFYTSIIGAGENSGRLPEVLSKLADFTEAQSTLKNKVQSALIYPVFMVLVSIFIISFLFTFVVPKITRLFEDTSAALPLITVVLIWISNVLHSYWWLIMILTAGAVFLYRWLIRHRKELVDALLLKLPFGALKSLYTARFSMAMSFLLAGGVPILSALRLSSKTPGNTVLEKQIIEAQNRVSQGAKLSTSLEGFSPTFLQLLSTGEQSGQLAQVLERAAASYEADFDKKLQRAVSLLEPILILFMGLVVGFIVIAVLLPVFELNQLIK